MTQNPTISKPVLQALYTSLMASEGDMPDVWQAADLASDLLPMRKPEAKTNIVKDAGADRGSAPETIGQKVSGLFDLGKDAFSYGVRNNNTIKRSGFFGELPIGDGRVMTEMSIGVNLDGQETEIPLLVPGMTEQDIQNIASGNVTDDIINKAIEFAKIRKQEGKPVFATHKEQGKFIPSSDIISSAVSLRQLTEGNSTIPYSDVGGIAIGNGLNLTVQNKNSLRKLVGGDAELFRKLSPFVGKKFSELSKEDKEKLVLSEAEVKRLNSAMVKVSLEDVANVSGNLSDTGVMILADIAHWTGMGGLRSPSSSKLGISESGTTRNPVADVINSGKATDSDLKAALLTIMNGSKKQFVKDRIKKYINIF